MKRSLTMMCLILTLLVLLDFAVAGVLALAKERGKLGSLVQYFEYGRSVPGKLAQWEANPERGGNFYDVAWRSEMLRASAAEFSETRATSEAVVRSYGMSFVDNILEQAQAVNPDITLDLHSGPSAPANFSYALFLDDAPNRQPGDVAVFGILSSAVPALAAMSNRTWVFEQPAPFTYPVFHPDGDSLRRIEPLINAGNAERDLSTKPTAQTEWINQLSQEDMFYSPITLGATWADYSPFLRLVRRSLAIGHIERTKVDVLEGAYPYTEVLQTMIATFADIARNDGQIPIVVLVQSREAGDVDVLEIAKPILARHNIPYFATAEHFSPHDLSGFLSDGHYLPQIDRMFGEKVVDLIEVLKVQLEQ